MAWSIVKKGGPGKIPTYREFIVDTENDISTLPVIPDLPAGCKAYCSENGNTYILETDGDWAVKSSGGGTGGASSLEELDDVDISNPQANQMLTYNSTQEKWVNSSPEPYPGWDLVLKLDIDTSVAVDTGDVVVVKGDKDIVSAKALAGIPINVSFYVITHNGNDNIYGYSTQVQYYFTDYGGIYWFFSGSCMTETGGFTFEINWKIDGTFEVAVYNLG